jgi:hypothetical protein
MSMIDDDIIVTEGCIIRANYDYDDDDESTTNDIISADLMRIDNNQQLDDMILPLPSTLHTLIFGCYFSYPLINFKFPQSLITLIINGQNSSILNHANLNVSLHELIFNGDICISINHIKLPNSLRILKLGNPKLTINNSFRPMRRDEFLIDVTFDSTHITHLTIGRQHTNSLRHNCIIISKLNLLSITELTLGATFNQNISNVKFRDISIIHDYSGTIYLESCAFPNTLYKIIRYINKYVPFVNTNKYTPLVIYERKTGQHTKTPRRF